MSDYPVVLQVAGRLCVVVGGGPVACRKASGLLAAEARVRLIAPGPPTGSEPLEGVEIVRRPYLAGDLDGAALAFAATDDRALNARITEDARKAGIPINVADHPGQGDFNLPALLRRGQLTVAVSSGGLSPALSVLVRDRLAEVLGPEWGPVLEIVSALRQNYLTLQRNAEYTHVILRLLESGLPNLVAHGETDKINGLLGSLPGGGTSLSELGIRLPRGTK